MTEATPPVQADTGASGTPAPTGTAPAAPTTTQGTPPAAVTTHTPPLDPKADPAAPQVTPNAEVAFKLPDAYKDKPWAAKIKTEDDLYKQIENAQALLGRKQVVPDLGKASDAEREEYYAQLRPADVEAYGLKDVPDTVLLPDVKTALGEQLLKQGISPVQAKPILEAVAKASDAEAAKLYAPENFQVEAEKVMGANYDPKPLNAIIKSNLSADAYAGINALPNVQLAAIHRAMKELVDQYGIKETSAHTETTQGKTTPPDVDAQRAQYRKEIADLRHKPHTEADKKKLTDALAETYKTHQPTFGKPQGA